MLRKYVEIIELNYHKIANKCWFRILIFPFTIIWKILQWTKKCYFFHIMFILCSPIFIFAILLELSYGPPYFEIGGSYITIIYILGLPTILLILYSFPLTLIAMIIKFIFKRKITVTSNFLLHNKWYNAFYIFSIVFILLALNRLFYRH